MDMSYAANSKFSCVLFPPCLALKDHNDGILDILTHGSLYRGNDALSVDARVHMLLAVIVQTL